MSIQIVYYLCFFMQRIYRILVSSILLFVLIIFHAQNGFTMSLAADSLGITTGEDAVDAPYEILKDTGIDESVQDGIMPEAIDVEGNSYRVVKIGSLYWMAENLRTTTYNDGTPVPLIEDFSRWSSLSSPAFCWYQNAEEQYKSEYGALYNWYAINSDKLCPSGWHIPSDKEWKKLEIVIGLSSNLIDSVGFRGTNEAVQLKIKSDFYWRDRDIEEATNKSGFSAVPGGGRSGHNSLFYSVYEGAGWWSSTEYKLDLAWMRGINKSSNTIMRLVNSKKDGLSVRCVKDQ